MIKQSLDDAAEKNIRSSDPSRPEDGGTQPVPAEAVRTEVHVDELNAAVCYANFCRVTGTPEELILDFGLNAQPNGADVNVEIKQRLVVNYFTAKRLLHALNLSVQRHEHAFGALETDVQKRVSVALRRAVPAG